MTELERRLTAIKARLRSTTRPGDGLEAARRRMIEATNASRLVSADDLRAAADEMRAVIDQARARRLIGR